MFHFIILGIVFALGYLFLRNNLQSIQKGPPGPIRWPIIGSFPQMLMLDSVYPHLQLHGLSKKYGDIMSIGFGSSYAVVLSSYEVMKDILTLPETNDCRFRFQFVEHRSFGKNLGIVFAYGDVWEQQRKFSVRRLREFGFGKTLSMEESIRKEVEDFNCYIRREILKSGGEWKADENRFSVIAINILWGFICGYRFDPDDPKIRKHLDINRALFDVIGIKNILTVFPFLKIFPNWSGFNRHAQLHKDCWEFMKEVIEDVKVKRTGKEKAESFVEVYLDEIEKHKNEPHSNFTEEQLTHLLTDFFLAGSDSTSNVMNWLILYLALHPIVQDKIREEIFKFSPDGTNIPATASSQMPYLRAFVLETWRHSLSGPQPPSRGVSKDINYKGYRIPAGTLLLSNHYPSYSSETFWGDPQVFRPERFFQPNSNELDPKKVARMPVFGFGKRICPGEAMVMDTLFLFLTTLLSEFSLGLISGKVPTTQPGPPDFQLRPKPYSITFQTIK